MIHPATYECDKCKKIQDTPEQFWEVGIKAQAFNYTSDSFVNEKFKMQVCRPCLESFGIYAQQRKASEAPAPQPPTLEELIVEIVRQNIPNAELR